MKLHRTIFNTRATALAAGAMLAVLVASNGFPQQPLPNQAATATNAFGLDLYRQLSSNEDNAGNNLWFSPWSITSALAMTAEGARGNTLVQMAKTLHFNEPSPAGLMPQIHESMAALSQQLTATGGPASPLLQTPYELVVANALWSEQRYRLDQKYVDTISKYYGVAGLFPVDFRGNAEAARSRINAWVEEQTRKKITDLLAPNSVDSSTRFVLTNAVYFKGSWATPFTQRATSTQPFHLDGARTVPVPLMSGSGGLYMENDQLQAVALPFIGRSGGSQDIAMIVILPKQVDGIAALEKSLTGAQLDAWIGALSSRPVQVFLPKFSMTNGIKLAETLNRMGMPDAFAMARANFSGISPDAVKDQLYISSVGHKAYLDVNENGAEAAAASYVAIEVGTSSRARPVEPVVFRADHPFLVLIRHNPSGTILFLGRVMNPAVQ